MSLWWSKKSLELWIQNGCPSLGSHTNLTFYHDQFTVLPPEIGNFESIEYLCVCINQLTSLPPEIGKLTSLIVLTISDNQISELPPEIGNLINLQALHASCNKLTQI